MKKFFALLLIRLSPVLLAAQVKRAVHSPSLVFNHVTVIDMKGARPKPDMIVIIQGNRISTVGKSAKTRLVGKMQKAGVGILAGTDDANPYSFVGFGLHDELAMLVEAGLTPLQALQAATLNPAKFFNKLDSL
jgi:imidazolonepropionase-like amidohydrolase